jgi:hypothetical protein
VVGLPGKSPGGIEPSFGELAFDFTERTFQLRRYALKQRGAGVRGCAGVG